MAEKNCFDMTKLIFQIMCHCGAVVKELLERADKPGSTPDDVIFCFFVPFFLCLVSFFNTIFPFGLFFFVLNADPAGHALGSIYILSLSPEFYFGKGISYFLSQKVDSINAVQCS